MNKKVLFTILSVTLTLSVFVLGGCNDNKEDDYKRNREVYMSNNVNLKIVFPLENDSILYKDSTSGFGTYIKSGELGIPNFTPDSVVFQGQKKKMKMEFSIKNFNIYETTNGTRNLSFDGEATLYLNGEMTPLVLMPVDGFIKGNDLIYSSINNFFEKEKPYINISFKGTRIE